jgi:hypothetical protein
MSQPVEGFRSLQVNPYVEIKEIFPELHLISLPEGAPKSLLPRVVMVESSTGRDMGAVSPTLEHLHLHSQ